MESSLGRLDPSAAAAYFNPFEQAAVQQTLKDIERAGELQKRDARLSSVGQPGGPSAFGGSRAALEQIELDRNILEQQARTAAQMRQAGFESAAQRAQQAGQLGSQIGSGIGGLGTQFGQLNLAAGEGLSQLGLRQAALGQTGQQLGQTEQGFLFDLGKQQQAQDQAVLEAQRQTELQQAYEPYQRVGFLSDIYKGAPTSTQTITASTSPSVSPAQTILGLGIGGLSAAAGAKQAGLFLMMNRGLMKRQMFAKGGPVRMQGGGLAGIQSSLTAADTAMDRAKSMIGNALGGQMAGAPTFGVATPAPNMGGISSLAPKTDQESPLGMFRAPFELAFQNRAQGFAEGGAAFPDLTGDGEVTYADILKGRGVEMQMGGEPMAAQQAAMMQAPMPQDPTMESAAAEATKMGINPSDVEGMLNQVSEGIGNLDDAEDFEQVINSMRGDEAPLSERYGELAELVGEEDAKATPESVLTLVQPIVQIAQVDQGIGGLAQEEMSAPVEGNMAGGIMSTVNMGEEVPAPVNFNQGGPVVAMQQGGEGRLAQLFQEQRDVYGTLLDPASTQQAFDEQKDLTKAQMLFDIANTALAFATPGERQMSPAERLASVTQETQLFDKIGARAQSLQDLKTKQAGEKRAMDLAALQAASGLYSAERSAELSEAAAEKARLAGDIGDIYKVTITKPDGTTETMERPVTLGQYNDLMEKHGAGNVSFSLVPKKASTAQGAENFLVDGQLVSAIKGTPEHTLYASTGVRVGNLSPEQ